ncbi:DUF1014-domain-containing protein [Polychaeton citri CBS 116435]|uniref:DUF1014-domain-containing protein n=1 Tax=Polychaeton citri CBS 116435 TaxID=1314669 RepID=A0A9P4Q493_9PEZI|nr:DUF1014-domain-containing protein [Polychaeton citri CBS 116435]
MAGKKGGENSKKVAGNAKKAEAAAQKSAVENQKKAAVEGAKWKEGAKDSSKAEAAAAKKAEADRKAAEKKALLAEEEASLPSKPVGGKNKGAVKKSRGLDLSGLDAPSSKKDLAALNASNIDDALDALTLTSANGEKIDRHPERRFKAAYAAYEERRLEEMQDEKGLRRQQKIEQIRKEFEKHPDNPFNQVNAGRFDLNKDEMKQMRESNKDALESRLAG